MITRVELSRAVEKAVRKLPANVVAKLLAWAASVEELGLAEVRKRAGYHDEPLHGDRAGQRSIRLNKAYRAFYVVSQTGVIEIVSVFEVNKHGY